MFKIIPPKRANRPKNGHKSAKSAKKSFFWHRLSQMSSNEWIINKKLKSETLHPKRVPFHPELPSCLIIQVFLQLDIKQSNVITNEGIVHLHL